MKDLLNGWGLTLVTLVAFCVEVAINIIVVERFEPPVPPTTPFPKSPSRAAISCVKKRRENSTCSS